MSHTHQNTNQNDIYSIFQRIKPKPVNHQGNTHSHQYTESRNRYDSKNVKVLFFFSSAPYKTFNSMKKRKKEETTTELLSE